MNFKKSLQIIKKYKNNSKNNNSKKDRLLIMRATAITIISNRIQTTMAILICSLSRITDDYLMTKLKQRKPK